MTFLELVQQTREHTPTLIERWLPTIGILVGWAIALALFFWRVGIAPIKRSINGVGRRTGALEEWRERADERWRQGDLDKQRWDATLNGHAEEMGEMRSEMRGLRDHMDDAKVDILGAIKESTEKHEQQFREMRDRLKDVEVTVRERRRDDGDR